jgi:hypothetical protein
VHVVVLGFARGLCSNPVHLSRYGSPLSIRNCGTFATVSGNNVLAWILFLKSSTTFYCVVSLTSFSCLNRLLLTATIVIPGFINPGWRGKRHPRTLTSHPLSSRKQDKSSPESLGKAGRMIHLKFVASSHTKAKLNQALRRPAYGPIVQTRPLEAQMLIEQNQARYARISKLLG